MPLQFRRGTNAQRLTITPAVGEPIWTTNTNRLYVGDGVTPGGVAVEIPLPSTGTFTSLTVTNIHFTGDPVGVDQTTAWTGTVAWSQIGSKPNGGLYTTSTVEFNQLSVTGSAITATQSSIFINATTSTSYEPPHTTGYLLWGIEQTASARLVTDAYSGTSPTVASVWTGRKARGTASAPSAVQSGDLIFRLAGTGFGTTEFANTSSGYLDILATENFTDGARGTRITLNTTNAGTNTPNASLSVSSDGTIITAPTATGQEPALFINKDSLTTYQPLASTTDGYAIWAITSGTSTRGMLDAYGNGASTDYTTWQGRRARGTPSAPTAVQQDDIMLSLRANGFGSTQFGNTSTAFINFSATENFSDTSKGSRIALWATPQGDFTPDTVAVFRTDGTTIYSTATNGTSKSQLIVQGSYPNLSFKDAEPGTNILAVNTPGLPGRIDVDTYADDLTDDTDKSYLTGRRARGTASAPTQALAGDGLLRVAGYAYGTTKFLSTATAGMNFTVIENATDNAAGGRITFDALPIGAAPVPANQQIVATMTVADGLTVDQLNVNDLTINNAGEILTSNTTDIDIFTNQGTGPYSEVWVKHDESVVINTNGGAESWVFDKTGAITFPDATVQNTAWTGTVANSQITSVSTSKVNGLSVVGWTNNYNDLNNKPTNQALFTTSTVQFAGITDTGPLSVTGFSSLSGGATASALTVTNAATVGTSLGVTGLATLSGGATISAATVTNNLTAGATTLQSLTVTTGTVLNRTLSAGGYPLNAAGTASWGLSSGLSPIMLVSNWNSGVGVPVISLRGYGQNNPNGVAATLPNPNLRIESSRGTNSAPTAMQANQNLGGVIVGGYDGNNWTADQLTAYNFLGWFASENMTFDSVVTTATYQAGSGFGIFVQPQWTRPGINATRQRFLFTNWATTSSTGPSQLNLSIGSGADGANPTMTMVDGTTYTGYGRTNFAINNAQTAFFGVPSTDTAPDNNTLTGTNIINIISGRRSGTAGRRNQVVANDNLGGVAWRSQSANNSTGNGNQNISIIGTALETQAAGAQGARVTISTVNSGTTSLGVRMAADDRLMQLSANQYQFNNGLFSSIPLTFTTSTWNSSIDTQTFGNNAATVNMLTLTAAQNDYRATSHVFKDASGLTTGLTLSTSTAVFNSGVQITTYNRTYAEVAYTGTTIVATATNTIYAFPLNTTNVANGIVIQNGQQIKFNQVGGGFFKIIMSLQAAMATNSIGSCDFWLRKNGVDVPNSATQIDFLKDQKGVIPMDWLVNPAVNDYYEIVYAVDDTNFQFPWFAAQTSPYIRPAVPPIIVNVIPVGA